MRATARNSEVDGVQSLTSSSTSAPIACFELLEPLGGLADAAQRCAADRARRAAAAPSRPRRGCRARRCSSAARTLTGTITRKSRSSTSPRRRRKRRMAPVTVARTTSLSVPPSAFFIALIVGQVKPRQSKRRCGPMSAVERRRRHRRTPSVKLSRTARRRARRRSAAPGRSRSAAAHGVAERARQGGALLDGLDERGRMTVGAGRGIHCRAPALALVRRLHRSSTRAGRRSTRRRPCSDAILLTIAKRSAVEALDEPDLPQRLRAIELLAT